MTVLSVERKTDGARTWLQMRRINVFFGAGVLFHLLVGPADEPGSLIVNRLSIEFRIDHRQFEVQVADVGLGRFNEPGWVGTTIPPLTPAAPW